MKAIFPCFLTNAHSILNKFSELNSLIDEHKPYVIGITEIWCDSSILDSELYLNQFNLFCKDHSHSKGGGVLLHVHKSLKCLPCSSLNELNLEESLWYLIPLQHPDAILVGTVYCSPSSAVLNNEN